MAIGGAGCGLQIDTGMTAGIPRRGAPDAFEGLIGATICRATIRPSDERPQRDSFATAGGAYR